MTLIKQIFADKITTIAIGVIISICVICVSFFIVCVSPNDKKIICSVDFLNAAVNGIEYAAKFSQVFNAELHVLNLQSLFPEAVISGKCLLRNYKKNCFCMGL